MCHFTWHNGNGAKKKLDIKMYHSFILWFNSGDLAILTVQHFGSLCGLCFHPQCSNTASYSCIMSHESWAHNHHHSRWALVVFFAVCILDWNFRCYRFAHNNFSWFNCLCNMVYCIIHIKNFYLAHPKNYFFVQKSWTEIIKTHEWYHVNERARAFGNKLYKMIKFNINIAHIWMRELIKFPSHSSSLLLERCCFKCIAN